MEASLYLEIYEETKAQKFVSEEGMYHGMPYIIIAVKTGVWVAPFIFLWLCQISAPSWSSQVFTPHYVCY